MKRIAYSFLLILLLSCGGSHAPSSRNRITVQFKDSVIKDFYLLAVHDSTLVVSPYTGAAATAFELSESAHAVPFEKIEKIYFSGRDYATPLFAGCAGGCIGFCSTGYKLDISGDDDGMTTQGRKLQPYFTGVGFLAGFLIAYFTIDTDKEFSLLKKNDLDNLRNVHSFYNEKEPSELQKIK